jgi:DNA-binding response OmpR family regulator
VIGFYTLSTDITEMKRIDRMKNEFVSMVSHELRTPLTSIRGSLGLLTGGVAGMLPDAARNLVDIAKNNCERLIRLINDILDTEKMESGKMHFDMKVVELGPLVAQSIAANEGFALQLKVTFKLIGSGDSLRVNVDSDGLSQVLTNLLSNAAKFSPPGATVEVGLTHAQGRVRVEVRDRGAGIPEEFRPRIFQKFSQADSSASRQKGGSGLGLNISKAIVERLGGMIGFTTQTGVGTTFFFELPEWQEAPASVFASASRAVKRPCVLVCEDDPDIARLIGMMLDKAGYDTDLALTAARARELAVASPYAAMTVDLKLPDQDGISLMRELREDKRTSNLPIVVVSAMSEQGRIQLNSEILTVSDWLGKPIDENRLVVAIRDAVAGRAQDRPRILHVEDDPDIQHISAAIARDFATFEFAATVPEARARLRSRKYDLIVLDLNLAEGEGSGWELVADVDALDPPPPVVVFSGRDVSHAESLRVAAVLMKAHTSNEEFLETLERVLERGPRSPAPKATGAPIAQAA